MLASAGGAKPAGGMRREGSAARGPGVALARVLGAAFAGVFAAAFLGAGVFIAAFFARGFAAVSRFALRRCGRVRGRLVRTSGVESSGAMRDALSPIGRRVAAVGSVRVRWALLAILVVALAARVAVVAGTPDYRPFGDPADYDRHAVWLAGAGTYAPTAYANPGGPAALRPPAYPYALAAVYKVTGGHLTAGRILNIALGVAAVLLLFLLALRLLGPPAAVAAGALAAVFPPLVWLSAGLAAENVFIPLMLGALVALARLRAAPARRWALLAGALIGLAALARSNGAVLVVPAALAIAGAGLARRRAARLGALALAAFVLVMAPWTIRNAAAFGRFLPLGTQSGYTMAGQYNDRAAEPGYLKAIWRVPQTVPGFKPLFHRADLDEGIVDASLRRQALDFAWRHPGYVLDAAWLNARRMIDVGPAHEFTRLVSDTEMGIPRSWFGITTTTLHVALLLALLGALLLALRRTPLRLPAYVWITPLLLFLSVVGWSGAPRYRTPLDPFLLVFAATALISLSSLREITRNRG